MYNKSLARKLIIFHLELKFFGLWTCVVGEMGTCLHFLTSLLKIFPFSLFHHVDATFRQSHPYLHIHLHTAPVNVKIVHLNYVRMEDQERLLRIVHPNLVPLFPMQRKQMRDQPRVFPTKVMVSKLQCKMGLISSLMKAKEEVKGKSTSNQKERELVLWPRVDLQLLAGLGLASMSMAEPENTIVRYYCIKLILVRSPYFLCKVYILRSSVLVSCNL